MKETPMVLMVPAATVAYITFRAAMAPPRVMLTNFPASYACFRLFNATAFYTSLIILLLLSSRRFHSTRRRMAVLRLIGLLDLLCFVAAYVFGSSPDNPLRGLANLLAGAISCGLIYSGVAIREWVKRKIAAGNTVHPRV